jgi:hypothetical protein
MGWPRKNDGCRLYQERKDKSFVLAITENGKNAEGDFGAIANVHADAMPCLASTLVNPLYLYERCRRVQWSDLPGEWQRAFGLWMEEWDQTPEQIRGFWQVNQPRHHLSEMNHDI